MKTFIVFLALMLLLSAFLVYTSDMYIFARMQSQLKTAAEECACAAVLMLDKECYKNGLLVIDANAAEKAAALTAEKSRTGYLKNGSIECTLLLFDDEKGYEGCEALGIRAGRPAALATLMYKGEDMFRLPFINEDQMHRTAVFQWEFGLTSH